MMVSPDSSFESESTIAAGTRINHYKILSKIGSGAMGEVYLAQDAGLERQVALKFMKTSLAADQSARDRFVREARAAAALKHFNIVTIFEVSEYNGRPFIAMEYIGGGSLRSMLADGALPLKTATVIVADICDGLSEAHRHGIVHRDIKPANILLDENGRAKLVDFGLAHTPHLSGASDTELTSGTLAYMSPEQVRGEAPSVSSDLFSLGVTWYQMLTGELPFTGDYEASIIYSIANEDPVPVRNLCPDILPEVEKLVAALLEKDPKKRPREVSEVLARLREVQGDQASSSHGVSRRRPTVAWYGSIILILIAVAAIIQLRFDPLGITTPERETLAVMPFINLGPAEDEYFADGITDAITTHLARSGNLSVISRASSMLYRESKKNPQAIGAELGATYLLTGTILWEKGATVSHVRINAELVRVSDGSSVWADSYVRVLEKIFDLQSDIANNVTRALKIAVPVTQQQRLTRIPTRDLEAYDLYLRGNDYFNRSWDRRDIEIATDLYQQAIERDSNFAEAYAMLARGHASMYWEYFDHNDTRRQLALQAANKALELQPDLVEGHLALGYCYYHCGRDYQSALREFDLALASQPNNAELLNAIAAVQRRQGNMSASVENFARALELDPRSHLKAFDVGLTYGMLRQYDQAEQYLRRTVALAPDWPLPYIYRAWLHVFKDGDTARARAILQQSEGRADLSRSKFYWWLARIVEKDPRKILSEIHSGSDTAAFHLQQAQLYRLLGQQNLMRIYADSARAVYEQRLTTQPLDAGFESSLGLALAYLGDKDAAMRHSQKAIELLPTSKEAFDAPFLVLNLAEVLVIFEQFDAAVEQLHFLLSIPGFVSAPYLRLDPLWEPLRHRPDFQKLLAEAA
ncbi:MAG: protein kinase [Candidatus Zixiibacteriota bacterium]